jgi:hypothetical protein
VTRIEFLLGKQLPYVVLAMLNFFLMCAMAVFVFGVPMTGSFPLLVLAPCSSASLPRAWACWPLPSPAARLPPCSLPCWAPLIPATQFSGLTDPVSSLEGAGRWIGEIYPATYMFAISRGVFNKALGLHDLAPTLLPLLIAVPVIMGVAIWACPSRRSEDPLSCCAAFPSRCAGGGTTTASLRGGPCSLSWRWASANFSNSPSFSSWRNTMWHSLKISGAWASRNCGACGATR